MKVASHLWRFLLAAISLSPSARSMAIQGDTAIVGVGVLGKHLCRMILQESSSSQSAARVLGVTKTSNNHEAILKDLSGGHATADHGNHRRFQLVTSEDVAASGAERRFDNVVFCAPPSGFDDYPLAVQTAIDQLWAGPESGVFVFTSSGAVYDPTNGGIVTEASKINEVTSDTNPRVARLVRAERACLDAGGCCLRLAGLYDLQRGAHNFWLTSGKVIPSSPDGLINLLHYEDAASACLAVLRAGPGVCRSKTFLISDGHPMSRYAICQSALKAQVYQQQGLAMPSFAGEEQPWALGKIYDGSVSNKILHWNPRYESFDAFMEANA